MVTSLCCDWLQPYLRSPLHPLPFPHISPNQNSCPPHLIHTCPTCTSLFDCLFLLFRYKSKWPPPCHGYSCGAVQGETWSLPARPGMCFTLLTAPFCLCVYTAGLSSVLSLPWTISTFTLGHGIAQATGHTGPHYNLFSTLFVADTKTTCHFCGVLDCSWWFQTLLFIKARGGEKQVGAKFCRSCGVGAAEISLSDSSSLENIHTKESLIYFVRVVRQCNNS